MIQSFKRVVLLLCVILLSTLLAGEQASVSARIKFVIGKVQILASGKTNWTNARLNQWLQTGDRIKTTLNSRIEIVMPDGSLIKINENSIFDIKEIKSSARDNEDRMSFTLWAGNMWAKFKKIVDNRQVRKIESPNAVVAIRGTILDINVDQNQTTRVRVFKGRVVVASKEAGGQVTLNQDEESIVEKGKQPSPAKSFSDSKTDDSQTAGFEFSLDSKKLQYTDPAVLVNGIPVNGRIAPGTRITANSTPINVGPDGRFNGRVPVLEGLNEIRVTARKGSQSKAKTLRVYVNTKRPEIRLSQPIVAGFINRRDYSLSGAVFDPTPMDRAEVFFNDEKITEISGQGSFNRTVILNEGKNNIRIAARDRSGNNTIKAEQIFLDTVKPIITVTEPAQQVFVRFEPPRPPDNRDSFSEERFYQQIRGLIIDPEPSSGIKRITINGKEVKHNSDGSFETEIALRRGQGNRPGENRLSFYVEDMAGNISRDNSRVIMIR